MAVPSITVYGAHPGNTDSRSQRQLRCRAVDNLSHNLMSRDESWLNWRQISFDDVRVRTTNPASDDSNQNMPGLNLWTANILDLKIRSGR